MKQRSDQAQRMPLHFQNPVQRFASSTCFDQAQSKPPLRGITMQGWAGARRVFKRSGSSGRIADAPPLPSPSVGQRLGKRPAGLRLPWRCFHRYGLVINVRTPLGSDIAELTGRTSPPSKRQLERRRALCFSGRGKRRLGGCARFAGEPAS